MLSLQFAQASSTGRPQYVGMVKDNVTSNSVVNEFNIQHEDFPALPGAPGGGRPRGGGGGGGGGIVGDLDGQMPPQSSTPNSAAIQAILQHPFGSVSSSTDANSLNSLASLSQQLSSVINTSIGGAGGGSSSSSSSTSGVQNVSISSPPSAGGIQVVSSSTSGMPPSTRPASTESSGSGVPPLSSNNPGGQVTNQLGTGFLGGGNLGPNALASVKKQPGGAGANAASNNPTLGNTSSGVHLTKDGHIANIPPGMLTDQYGMAGLVALLQSTEQNSNLFSLSIGCDITNINLNLNSKEYVYLLNQKLELTLILF